MNRCSPSMTFTCTVAKLFRQELSIEFSFYTINFENKKPTRKRKKILFYTLWLNRDNCEFWLQRPNKFYDLHYKTIAVRDNQLRHEYIHDLLLSCELFTRFEGVRFSLSVKIFHGFSSAWILLHFRWGFFNLFFSFLSHWTWISMRCVKWNNELSWYV